jgi:hypothetical protein
MELDRIPACWEPFIALSEVEEVTWDVQYILSCQLLWQEVIQTHG